MSQNTSGHNQPVQTRQSATRSKKAARRSALISMLRRLSGVAFWSALAAFAVCSTVGAVKLARNPATSFPWWSAFPLTFLRVLPLLLIFGGLWLILTLLPRFQHKKTASKATQKHGAHAPAVRRKTHG